MTSLDVMSVRVTLQRPLSSVSPSGRVLDNVWETVASNVPANIKDKTKSELLLYGRDTVRAMGVAIIPNIGGIRPQETWRIVYQGRSLEIEGVRAIYSNDIAGSVEHFECDYREDRGVSL